MARLTTILLPLSLVAGGPVHAGFFEDLREAVDLARQEAQAAREAEATPDGAEEGATKETRPNPADAPAPANATKAGSGQSAPGDEGRDAPTDAAARSGGDRGAGTDIPAVDHGAGGGEAE